MGAIFGLAGIFVAACLYLFYALVKLVFLLATFAAQLIRARNATPPAAPRTRKRAPAGLKPKRIARKRKAKL